MKVRNDLGVKQKLITRSEILDLEPNLQPIFDAGVLFDYAWHARDPYAISKKLFDLYIKKGGKFIKENVTHINQTSSNETMIKTEHKEHTFEKTVVGASDFDTPIEDQK